MTLIGLVVFLLVLGLILWLIQQVQIDATIKRILYAVVVVVAVIYLLEGLGVVAYGPVLRLR